MAEDSQDLAYRARRGDQPALDELLVRHLPGLRAFVRLNAGAAVRARESATDLVQSVCREVLQECDDFEFRGEPAFRHWLYTMALRKIQDRARFNGRARRDQAREVSLGNPTGSDPGILACYSKFMSPSRQAMAHEDAARIEALFDRLPANYREIIALAHVIGLSHQEIAEKLGCTASYSRALLSRALARLARLAQGTEL